MENKLGVNSGGFSVKGEGFLVAARVVENPTNQIEVPTLAALQQPVNVGVGMGAPNLTPEGKKKRGRPRKYGPVGTMTAALSPMPISASIPFSGDFSGWKPQPAAKLKPFQPVKKAQTLEFPSTGIKIYLLTVFVYVYLVDCLCD